MIPRHTIVLFIGLLYLPGVFMHELAHFLASRVLGVPVYGFSIFPRVTPTGIIFGQVKIARVGFFKRFLIATAPLFLGSFSFLVCLYLLREVFLSTAQQIVVVYALLCTVNMMLPSRRDIAVIFGR